MSAESLDYPTTTATVFKQQKLYYIQLETDYLTTLIYFFNFKSPNMGYSFLWNNEEETDETQNQVEMSKENDEVCVLHVRFRRGFVHAGGGKKTEDEDGCWVYSLCQYQQINKRCIG